MLKNVYVTWKHGWIAFYCTYSAFYMLLSIVYVSDGLYRITDIIIKFNLSSTQFHIYIGKMFVFQKVQP